MDQQPPHHPLYYDNPTGYQPPVLPGNVPYCKSITLPSLLGFQYIVAYSL